MKLKNEEKEFIDRNWQRMTYEEMRSTINHKSIYNITKYCADKGYKKISKKELTMFQKGFVRNNYKSMTENKMANILGVNRFIVQEFKRSENLARYRNNQEKKTDDFNAHEIFFNVDSKEWVA